jgi:agmatinase
MHSPSYMSSDTIQIFSADTTAAGHGPSEEGQRATAAANYSRADGFSGARVREQLHLGNCVPERFRAERTLLDDRSHAMTGSPEEQADAVASIFSEIASSGRIPLCLGGDHIVKAGCIRAALRHTERLGVIYLDAHPDMRMHPILHYDTILHHSILGGLRPEYCVLLGLRQSNSEEVVGIEHYGPRTIFGSDFTDEPTTAIVDRISGWLADCDAIYVSIDPDGFNPIEVSAVEHFCPGGPTHDQFLSVLRGVLSRKPLAGMDISEHVPRLDEARLTAAVLAKIIRQTSSLRRIPYVDSSTQAQSKQ